MEGKLSKFWKLYFVNRTRIFRKESKEAKSWRSMAENWVKTGTLIEKKPI